jgi:hypothetical protein
MLKSKTKGLYLDVSEFSILAARTSGYKLPMVIEEVAELPIKDDTTTEAVRAFLEQLVEFKGGSYFVSRCGVYPEDRFLRYFEVESVNKLKDPAYLAEVLQTDFNVELESNVVSVLDARDGSDLDVQQRPAKQLVFCGGTIEGFQQVQDQLLEYGIYPDRLELASATTLGGVCDYARLNQISSPILHFELTSKNANVFILSRGQVEVARPVPFGLDSIYPLLQRELGLKDEASARKLFFSNTFDFAEMGPKLLRRMIKELQASAGFYEVQTGQAIDRVFISVLPKNLSWIAQTISDSLGLEILQLNLEPWLNSLDVTLADSVEVSNLGSRWLGLFSLMGEFHLREGVSRGES